ncbi:MAG TPA: glycosyltransferase family 4 protein [Acidimicrobiales bacterium]|nr:glycosyltransferase family 4 protein [Acidimicrobiales bacterium]
MRVLFVSSLWPPAIRGGAEMYAARLAAELGAAGHQTGVFTLGIDGPDVVGQSPAWPYRLHESETQPGWKRAAFHGRDQFDPVTSHRLRQAIDSFRPDVVHSHSIAGLSAAALTTPSARGVAHVHTLHDYWLLCQRTSLVSREGAACEVRCSGCRVVSGLRRAVTVRHFPPVLIAISDAVADEHRRGGVPAHRLRVIRHPVEPPPAAAGGERGRRRPGPTRLGFLGQPVAIKGLPLLLEALRSLDEVELLVAGEGPLVSEVQATQRARALGWVDDDARERFFAEIDCLVVPSAWREPAGLVVNEARSRGLPVIAARIGGLPELVPQTCRPLLFEPRDASDLVAKIRMFMADPDRFAPGPEPAMAGWAGHLDEILEAYADAGATRAR